MDLKVLFEISLKKSVLYVALRTFLLKSLYLIFGVQTFQDAAIFNAIFSQPYKIAVFGVVLVLGFESYKKRVSIRFVSCLLLSISIVLISYVLNWATDMLFAYVHQLGNTPEKTSTGILSLASFTPYDANSFDLWQYFVMTPYIACVEFITTGSLSWLMALFATPSFFMAVTMVYCYSVFLWFKDQQQAGYWAFIPILHSVGLLKLANKPLWWVLPMCIPFVRYIPKYAMNLSLARELKRSKSYAIGMTFVPWFFYGKALLDKV